MAEAKIKETKANSNDNSKLASYDYRNGNSFKLSDEFKRKYIIKVQQRDAIKAEGLTVLGHAKGMWKFETTILQYPNKDNNNTCICQTSIGGYDWDPIEQKVTKVEYCDIGDANPSNCTRNVAPSFIRMASTRSQARALRKYTNYDMLCADELRNDDVYVESDSQPIQEPMTPEMFNKIKEVVKTKGINESQFGQIMIGLFNHTNMSGLSMSDANKLLETVSNFAV